MTALRKKLRTPTHDLRERMEAAVERLIAFLDTLDAADEDLEDGEEDGDDDCDAEPSLAAPEPRLQPMFALINGRQVLFPPDLSQVVWCKGGGEDGEEGDDNGLGDSGGLSEQLDGREEVSEW